MLRMSDGLTALLAGDVGLRRGLRNFYINFYTGTQPADANQAPTGQKIIAFRKCTNGTDAFTGEAQPVWTVTLSGGSGSLNTLKVGGFDILGGAVSYATSLDNTRDLIVAQINNNIANLDFKATAGASGVFTVTGPCGVGTLMNSGFTMVSATTTLTATVSNSGNPTTAGVDAVNACNFLFPVDGATLTPAQAIMQLSKETATWAGKAGYNQANSAISGFTSGTLTAGWCRVIASPTDDDTLSTGVNGFLRMDMSVGTAGTDVIILPSAAFTFAAVTTISSFTINVPKIAG